MIGIPEVSDVAVSTYHQNLKVDIQKENDNSYWFRHITIFLKVTFMFYLFLQTSKKMRL